VLEQRGVDRRWQDGADVKVVGIAHLLPQALGQPEDGELTGHVRGGVACLATTAQLPSGHSRSKDLNSRINTKS
jgi:hypothetical protein